MRITTVKSIGAGCKAEADRSAGICAVGYGKRGAAKRDIDELR
jgi:hypothetical protein